MSIALESPLLRPTHAAKLLAVAPKTIYRMIEDGRLEGVRLGDWPGAPVRVRASSLERLAGESLAA